MTDRFAIRAYEQVAGEQATYSLVNIPGLAEGGIVKRPTSAVVGESGPEAIVPLAQYRGGTSGDGITVPVKIQGNVIGIDDLARQLASALETRRVLLGGREA